MNAKANEAELKIFNKFLLASGENEKNIKDYKKHFNNWKRKNPPELNVLPQKENKVSI